jgi:hypothetical protein
VSKTKPEIHRRPRASAACHARMQYTTLGRERKGSVTSTTHNVASWFSSLKRTKKGRNYKTEATSKSAWDLSTIRTVVGWFCAARPSTPASRRRWDCWRCRPLELCMNAGRFNIHVATHFCMSLIVCGNRKRRTPGNAYWTWGRRRQHLRLVRSGPR